MGSMRSPVTYNCPQYGADEGWLSASNSRDIQPTQRSFDQYLFSKLLHLTFAITAFCKKRIR